MSDDSTNITLEDVNAEATKKPRTSLKCIRCGCGDCRVIDARATPKQEGLRRRRMCRGCGLRFTTVELSTEMLESLGVKALRHVRKI
jgi:hypothetical protein